MSQSKKYPRFSGEWLILVLAVLAVIHAWPVLDSGERQIDVWVQIKRLAAEFFPPDFSVLPQVLVALNETVQIATLSTLIATGFSLVVALFGSFGHWTLITASRLLLTVIRSVPSLVWAVIMVALIGTNPKAGVYALAIYSIGYLGKFFTDSIDQIDRSSIHWLRQNGASTWQIFWYGLWPSLKGTLISQSLWMWEYNIRSASIIGYVGVGGLGLQLHIYQEYGQWNRFSTVLLVIFLVVAGLELLSAIVKSFSRSVR